MSLKSVSLSGCRVLVTRPSAQAAGLTAAVRARGGEPIAFPLIRIVPPADVSAAKALLGSISVYDIVIFVSRNAVAQGLDRLQEMSAGDDTSLIPSHVRVLAVGAGTARDLIDRGVAAATVPGDRYDSEALLALNDLDASKIERSRVLIVKGEGGRERLLQTLGERGAQVDTVAVYARRPPRSSEADLSSIWRHCPPHAIVLTSVEATENLFALPEAKDRELSQHLRGAAYAVVSERVRLVLASCAPRARYAIARGASDEALAEAVAELWR